MKTTPYFTLTLFIFVTLAFVPNSFAQGNSPEYVVRVIYFHPNDIEPQEDSVNTLRTIVKDVQTFYADEMERHGFGRKTFRLETDENEDVVVHPLKGGFPNAHYAEHYGTEYGEVTEQLDMSKNIIYLIWSDIRHEIHLDSYRRNPIGGLGSESVGGNAGGNSFGGLARVSGVNLAVETWRVYPRAIVGISHELGHAFGLPHDFRDNRYIMSYGHPTVRNQLSSCAAKWLDVHRYFNTTQIASDQFPTSIEMLSPALVSRPNTIRLRFKVTDPDGLHQAVLLTDVVDAKIIQAAGDQVLDCKDLNGNNTTIEFVTTELVSRNTYVRLQVIDVHGNFTSHYFPVDIISLLPHSEVVAIPDANLAASIRENLGLAPDSTITQLDMLELTEFIAERGQITDLTGLEHATNLEYLKIHHNKIRNLTPLTGLTRLRFLQLEGNPITDVSSLAGLTQLDRLGIISGEINDIAPLGKLTRLTRLDLNNNQIADITPLKELINLSSLFLKNNKIGDEQLTVLTELPKLEVLSLAGNQVYDIAPLARLTNVAGLDLNDNQIEDITPLKGLANLRRLGLINNQIRDVSPLTGLTNLQILLLERNQISDVSPLEGLTNLELLNLVRTPVKNRKPLLELLRKNPDVKIYLEDGKEPLPVTLSHFRAELTHTGVTLKWITESEVDNAGFYIYRSETKDGKFKVLNPTMIQGAGTTSERNTYTWTDTTAKPNVAYYYRIEDISHAGVREQLATVRMRGHVSASGKRTTSWADLKTQEE